MMEKIREALTRKIGPLPAWAWGGLAAGGVWIWRGFRGTLSEPAPAPAADTVGLDGGLTPGMPSFGAPAGEESPLYVSADDYGFSIEGDPGTVGGIIEQLLARQRESVETGGGGYVPPAPEPGSQPAPAQQTQSETTTVTRYRLSPLGGSQVLGIFDSRLACAQAAAAQDPNSSPPGSSLGCYRV